MVRKQERKTNRGKTPLDIILRARVMKIHNLSIRQVALEFNINYCTLSRYCKKIPEYVITNYRTCDNQLQI